MKKICLISQLSYKVRWGGLYYHGPLYVIAYLYDQFIYNGGIMSFYTNQFTDNRARI